MMGLRECVVVHGHFSYSSWGMFRLPVVVLPWWHAVAVADEEDIEEFDRRRDTAPETAS
jgi:hypothetical protein